MLKKLFPGRIKVPKVSVLKNAIHSFSLTERVLFFVFLGIFFVSALALLNKFNRSLLIDVPDYGGTLTEGVVGSPRFLNPLLAIGDADKDLVSLVYSGLMRATPEGELIPDLAKSYTISSDGLTYDFILKDDLRFHDGSSITADDVEFTITKAQDPGLKSPKRASWEGVEVTKVSNNEIRFVLKQPYAPFLGNVTLGILPKKIWKNASADEFAFSEYNINPVGSGPYKVHSLKKSSAGIPNEYDLRSYNHYALGEPYITNIVLKFYSNESDLLSAYNGGDVTSLYGLSAKIMRELESKGTTISQAILPRVFAVFFNQNQATIFANKEVRQALNLSLDKNQIVSDVLFGYGSSIEGPVPPLTLSNAISNENATTTDRIAEAQKILIKAGWKLSSTTGVMEKKTKQSTTILSFSISTSDAPELKLAAQKIQEVWTKLGAKVDLQIFETGDLNQNIIRPRKYDALLFGEIIGRDLDLYPFWHSSQRNDPGLNIALYVNSKADKLLEEARKTTDIVERETKNSAFEKEIANDNPAVFLYSPNFLYILPSKIRGVKLGQITVPGERFLNINQWYIETNSIWKIFNH